MEDWKTLKHYLVNTLFFKFPSTPHLIMLSGMDIRSDKVLSESERSAFLQHNLVIEEKIDGANLDSVVKLLQPITRCI